MREDIVVLALEEIFNCEIGLPGTAPDEYTLHPNCSCIIEPEEWGISD